MVLAFELVNEIEQIPAALDRVEAYLMEAGGTPAHAAKLSIALDEILSNVIRHAYDQPGAHPIWLTADVKDKRLSLEVADRGPAFDPTARDTPDTVSGIEERAIGGLGIHFVKELMDAVAYRREDDLNRLRIELVLDP